MLIGLSFDSLQLHSWMINLQQKTGFAVVAEPVFCLRKGTCDTLVA